MFFQPFVEVISPFGGDDFVIERADDAGFQEAVNEAAGLCPVSRLFAGAKISVDAALDPAW